MVVCLKTKKGGHTKHIDTFHYTTKAQTTLNVTINTSSTILLAFLSSVPAFETLNDLFSFSPLPQITLFIR